MGFLDNYSMKSTKEQMDGELMVIKLFVSNYARDLISFVISRNSRTHSEYIDYGLYFYFSCLSLRKAADSRLSADYFIKRNHVSNWNWIQK
jgi:hypothetical protein